MTPPSDSIEALWETIAAGLTWAPRKEKKLAALLALADRAREAERERGISDEAGLDLARELQVAERERDDLNELLDAAIDREKNLEAEAKTLRGALERIGWHELSGIEARAVAREALAASESSDGGT